jgi:hypothetical protein
MQKNSGSFRHICGTEGTAFPFNVPRPNPAKNRPLQGKGDRASGGRGLTRKSTKAVGKNKEERIENKE